jgi:RNA polymerase sigma factor (sigma-70 family)
MPNAALPGVLRFLRRTAAPRDSASVTDAELLERFLSRRDEAAFELLVWRHSKTVLGVCRRVLRDEHEAEDAFQAAFIALACRATAIRKHASVGGWLYRVAYRVALDARARKARRVAGRQPLDDPPTGVRDPVAEAEGRELGELLDAEVNRLPEKYRVPFLRCCCEGESSAAVARELGCPAGTVESWLTRARQRLRRALARRGIALTAASSAAALAARNGTAAAPTHLVIATTKAAVGATAGHGLAGAALSANVAALTRGVLQTMLLTRLKIAAGVFLALSVLGIGAGLLAWTQSPGGSPSGLSGAAEGIAKPKPGQLFVNARFPNGVVGWLAGRVSPGIVIAVDPETGRWQKVGDQCECIRVSPDGRWLAFLRDKEIWSCDAAGRGEPARLFDKHADAAGSSSDFVWSPDGKQLVVTIQELLPADCWKMETWRLEADGSGRTRLPIPDTDAVEDWSPDGQWFVTLSDRHAPRGRGYQLYVMRPDGTSERRLTKDGLNCYARFSPDGQRLVYLHQIKGLNSLHVIDTDGTNDREIVTEKKGVAPEAACWSSDGKRLAVLIIDRPQPPGVTDWLGNAKPTTFHLELMDADGGNRQLLNLVGPNDVPSVPLWFGRPDWR